MKSKGASYYDQEYFDTNPDKGYTGPYGWGSAPWERLARAIVRSFGNTGATSLVDLGCARGYIIWYLQNSFGWAVKGYDFSEYIVSTAAPGVVVEQADITKRNTSIWRADLVLCMDTLEHIEDGNRMDHTLENIRQAAKKAAIIHVYVTDGQEKSTKRLPEHVTIHDRAWWRTRFLSSGFRTHELEPYYKTMIKRMAKNRTGLIWADDAFVLEPIEAYGFPPLNSAIALAGIQAPSIVRLPEQICEQLIEI